MIRRKRRVLNAGSYSIKDPYLCKKKKIGYIIYDLYIRRVYLCGDAKAEMMKGLKEREKKKQSVQSRRKIVTTILLCLCIAFIFHNSLEGAEVSGDRSYQLTQAMNGWFFGRIHMLLMEQIIRKLAHFLEYALEGALVVSVIWAYELKACRYVCHVTLFGIMTALIDETLQLFSDGRAALVGDVWIDFGGFLSGVFAGVLWMWVKRKIRARAIDSRGQ